MRVDAGFFLRCQRADRHNPGIPHAFNQGMERRRRAGAALALLLIAACGSDGGSSGFGGSSLEGGSALEETARPEQSAHPDLWLNSGGRFLLAGDGGSTLQGELPADDRWRIAYSRSSARDTDDGFRPQNLFRLVTRRADDDYRAEGTFTIRRTNRTGTPSRNASNGAFLFLRYRDGDHLYVAGIRVDGQAAIKKKNGGYRTMAIRPLYEGSPGAWSRDGNANLIPENRPIAIAAEVRSAGGGSVQIRLFVDGALVLEAVDDGRSFGGPAYPDGRSGVRTDFMDVELSGLRMDPL
jgi:hypothetical protein